jgi:hypothetical protein
MYWYNIIAIREDRATKLFSFNLSSQPFPNRQLLYSHTDVKERAAALGGLPSLVAE